MARGKSKGLKQKSVNLMGTNGDDVLDGNAGNDKLKGSKGRQLEERQTQTKAKAKAIASWWSG